MCSTITNKNSILDEDEHLTSAHDIALMSRELLVKHPEIKEYSSTWIDSLRDGTSELVNTNKLIRTYNGATGLKTGSTSLALYNLSASATRDNLSLIAVIMKAPTPKIRFSEAKLLLDYGFNSYSYTSLNAQPKLAFQLSVPFLLDNKFLLKISKIVLKRLEAAGLGEFGVHPTIVNINGVDGVYFYNYDDASINIIICRNTFGKQAYFFKEFNCSQFFFQFF